MATDPTSSTASRPATFYVTFSGERDKGGSAPINNVVAFDADGRAADAFVLDRLHHSVRLHILRGMAFGPDDLLYVANAHRTHSMILTFGPEKADGTRDMIGDEPFAHHERDGVALVHPYGLVFDRTQRLLVSSQDTYVVTRFEPDRSAAPVAEYLRAEFAHIPFLPGTLVASGIHEKHLPPPVPAEKGGLVQPRGIAYHPERHTVFVADEAVRAVRSYDAATGEFLGDIFQPHHHKGHPIGLHLDGDTLLVGSKTSDDVHAVDLSDGSVDKVVHHRHGDVRLQHPAGLVVGDDGALYVASHDGMQILRYDLDDGSAEVFVDELTDAPEHLVVVPRS